MSLAEKKCVPCAKGTPPMEADLILTHMAQVLGWELSQDAKSISRLYDFPSYAAGVEFVNRVAKMADEEKHHPDIELQYKKVRVRYTTHAAGGLSENDFICAAKADKIKG